METVPYISLFALLRFIIVAAFFLTYIGMRSGWFRSFFHAANNIIIYVCLRLYSCSITILTRFQLALYFHLHFLYYVGERCDSARREWKWLTRRNKEKKKKKKRYMVTMRKSHAMTAKVHSLAKYASSARQYYLYTVCGEYNSERFKADNRWTKQTRQLVFRLY